MDNNKKDDIFENFLDTKFNKNVRETIYNKIINNKDCNTDIKEKIYKTLENAKIIISNAGKKNEYYKKYLSKEQYGKLMDLIIETASTIDRSTDVVSSLSEKKDLDEFFYVINYKLFTLNMEIHNIRFKADEKYVNKHYKNNADRLLNDTNNILKDIDNNDLIEKTKIFDTTTSKSNTTNEDKSKFLYKCIMEKLDLQYSGIINFYRDTDVADKFFKSINDKIENVLNIKIDKSLQSTIKHNTPLSPLDLALVPMPIYQTAEINNFIGFNYKQKDKKPTPKKGNYLDNRLKNPTVEITKGKNTVQIDLSKLEISKSVKLDPKVHKTFVILLSELTKNIPHDTKICDLETAAKYMSVSISLRDYMEIRNLKDMKSARSQLRESLEMLHAASLSYTSIDKKGKEIVEKFHIIDYFKYELNKGIARINISPTLILHVALKKQLQNYNRNLLTINDKTNPNSFNLGHELLADARRNKNKENRNIDGVFIINTKKLLDVCGLKYDPHFTTRVLERFENDMDALVFNYNVLKSWNLCKKGREPLTDAELSELNYETFLETYVLYEPVQLD